MPAYVYIACRSHSGSTLLEKLLATGAGVAALGEFCHFSGYAADPSKRCSCGLPIAECAFWRAVLARLDLRADAELERVLPTDGYRAAQKLENLAYLGALLASPPLLARMQRTPASVAAENREHTRNHWRLVEAAAAESGATVLIDKSMAASRLLEIAATAPPGYSLCAIQLVRDGRANAHSHRELFGLPVAAGAREWRNVNLGIELARKRARGIPSLLVRYEDLCADPVRVLARIADRFALGLEFRPERVGDSLHAIGGNQAKLDGYSRVRLDERFIDGLSLDERSAFERHAGRLNRHYGYA